MKGKEKVLVLAVQQVFQPASSYTKNYKLFSSTYKKLVTTTEHEVGLNYVN